MSETNGEKLKKDPRVIEAKRLLKEVLSDHRNAIESVKPADEDLKRKFQNMLEKIAEVRGRPMFFPYISSGLGNGALVELADGSVKYDFITGIGVHYFGHSHPGILESSIDAALEDTIMQGNLQLNEASLTVPYKFISMAQKNGAKLDKCFLTSSGAMANENAFKIIFQKKNPANRLIAFKRCFTGRSLVAAQMTDKEKYREGLPKVLNIDYIPFFDQDRPDESTQESIQSLEALLKKHPGEYAAMCFELIQGEGGYYPGDQKFFKALMKILKDNNVAVMVDEIQTFARTPEYFAFQYYGLDDEVDVVTVGKMSQVCATLYTDEYNPRPGLLSQTFSSSTSALRAADFILEELQSGRYFGKNGKIEKLSKYFTGKLNKISKTNPDHLCGPFGLGAMIGFTVFEGSAEKSKTFILNLFDAGVLAYTAGEDPVRVRFLMPMGCVTERDIDQVCKIIEETLNKGAS